MPVRTRISLDDLVDYDRLSLALWRAARHCRDSEAVRRFSERLDDRLFALRRSVLDESAPEAKWTELRVFDPKPRRILAPSFADRVLHHALVDAIGPTLERALVDDTFACRKGKGSLAAVLRAQAHARRHPWFVKTDIRSYFASIDHGVLMSVLERRLKGRGVLDLCRRILSTVPGHADRGLPIGALTSQYFANSYLDALDRFLLETLRVPGMVRYMDDVVWWCDDRAQGLETLERVRAFIARERGLDVRADAEVGRTSAGVSFLGFRVLPNELRLSLRRRRRYAIARARWEHRYAAGLVDGAGLQAGFDAALAITVHAESVCFRRAELLRRLPVDA